MHLANRYAVILEKRTISTTLTMVITKELINKIFKGSKVKLFASFLNREILSDEEREQIKKLLDENE